MIFNKIDAREVSARERACATLCVRQMPASLLVLINFLHRLNRPPRLIWDRNGRGQPYLKLRYWSARRWRCRYVGRLDENTEALVRHLIAERWPVTQRELRYIIHSMRVRRQSVRAAALKLAASCGYRFSGYLLHKERS